MELKSHIRLNFLLTAFILSILYEATQSNMYTFYWADSIGEKVIFIMGRGFLDSIILLLNFNIVGWARIPRRVDWFRQVRVSDLSLFILLGLVFVQYNEVINVYYTHSWGYKVFMPLMPIFKIGISPFIQWLFFAPLILIIYYEWFPEIKDT